MKKLFGLCLPLLITTTILSGCGASPAGNDAIAETSNQLSTEANNQQSMDSNATAKKLVVYFSMPETTNPHHMSREEELSTVVIGGEILGNTQYIAYVIK